MSTRVDTPDAKHAAPTTAPEGSHGSANGATAAPGTSTGSADDTATAHDGHTESGGPVTPEGERLDTDTKRVESDPSTSDSGGTHRS